MGIDVTSGPGSVAKKFSIIRDHIRDETLTNMKYFHSERSDIKGRKGSIPQLVIGADARTISELATLWLDTQRPRMLNKEATQSELEELREKAKDAQKKLSRHRARVLILQQIKDQLEVYIDFATRNKKGEAEEKYKKLLPIVSELLAKAELSHQEVLENEVDDVYRAIKQSLATFAIE